MPFPKLQSTFLKANKAKNSTQFFISAKSLKTNSFRNTVLYIYIAVYYLQSYKVQLQEWKEQINNSGNTII